MCLENLTTKEPLIAKKDIVVYKYIIKVNQAYLTYYRHKIIKIGKTYRSKLIKIQLLFTKGLINEGLHSMKYKKDACYMAKDKLVTLVKCVIPKGSKYYEGSFNFRGESYKSLASNKLKYLEIIKDFSD